MTASQRIAVVTGASSGIGAATAVEMGQRGWRVAVGARRADRIESVAKDVEAAGGAAFAHPLDVTDAASIEAFCSATEAHFGPVDLLINNAGQNLSARIDQATTDELRLDLEVNLLGAMWMTRRLVGPMIEAQRGDVVFLGSDSARNVRPYQGAYGAAKAGLEAFSRVLEMETEGTGVRSFLIRVGPTGSEFGSRMPADRIPEILEAWKYWGVLRHLHWMPPEAVARAIVRTIDVPVDESYTTVLEIQPGGRSRS
jgi:NADP-dependent 3-hydroxy acid dehydrogenase YdfG